MSSQRRRQWMAALQMAACWTGSTTQTAGVLPDGNGIDDVVDGRQAAGGVADGLAIDDGA